MTSSLINDADLTSHDAMTSDFDEIGPVVSIIDLKIPSKFQINSIIQTKVINDSVFLYLSTENVLEIPITFGLMVIISELHIQSPPNFHERSVLCVNLMLQNFKSIASAVFSQLDILSRGGHKVPPPIRNRVK